jgi:hypothetical protein
MPCRGSIERAVSTGQRGLTGPANRRWLLEQALTRRAGRSLEEACAELGRLFSGPPEQRGKCTWQHRCYDLVRFEDGTVGFVRNALHAEIDQAFAKALNEIYGPEPEPAEDD